MLTNFWFLIKIERGFNKNKLESRIVPKKAPVLKTDAICGIRYIRNSLDPVCVKSGMG